MVGLRVIISGRHSAESAGRWGGGEVQERRVADCFPLTSTAMFLLLADKKKKERKKKRPYGWLGALLA